MNFKTTTLQNTVTVIVLASVIGIGVSFFSTLLVAITVHLKSLDHLLPKIL